MTTTSTGKRATFVTLAAIALLVGVTSGLAYSQVAWTQTTELSSESTDLVGAMSASRKTQCIMPAAWRRSCEG